MIGVGGNEFDPLGAVGDHVFDGIPAAAAHADHFDHGVERINFLKDFESHESPLKMV